MLMFICFSTLGKISHEKSSAIRGRKRGYAQLVQQRSIVTNFFSLSKLLKLSLEMDELSSGHLFLQPTIFHGFFRLLTPVFSASLTVSGLKTTIYSAALRLANDKQISLLRFHLHHPLNIYCSLIDR